MVPFGERYIFLETEFLDPFFIRRDCRATSRQRRISLMAFGAVDSDLVVGLVSLLDAKVVIFQVYV